jgi:hypothetical protein
MDFFAVHPGYSTLILLGCAFFPRITMFFIIDPFSSLLHALGWVFIPHFMVAILATFLYWETNPLLVVISWLLAFPTTGTEAKTTMRAGSKATSRVVGSSYEKG